MENDFLKAFEIAKRLGINKATVSQLAARHNLNIKKLSNHDIRYSLSQIKHVLEKGRPNGENRRFVEPFIARNYWDGYWKLDWKEAIVASDAHSPFTHEGIINLMLKVANHYGIKNFLHAGDFWNQDQFSTWWVAKEDLVEFSKEVEYSNALVDALVSNFSDVRFFLGSHDVRMWKLLYDQGKATAFDDIWQLLNAKKKIKISSYRYCDIGKEWRVSHPKSVVKIGGLPSIRLFAKHHKSLIFGHGHWWGHEYAPDGIHHLIAPGCLVDKQKVPYKNIWDTSHNEWVAGFVVIFDGNKPILFSEDTPWGRLIKK